jgi:hypothetical protein
MTGSRIVAEYNLPYVGNVRIMNSAQEPEKDRIHGIYWARVENLGIVARFSECESRVMERVSEEIIIHLMKKRKELSREMAKIDELIPTTSIGIISSGHWFSQYKLKAGKNQE